VKTVRIANAGGFWGDWLEAPKKQIFGGPIDYLTMDYLAELTMSMLARQLVKYPDRGFIFDFIKMLEELLPEISKRKIKVISNAGGMNPKGCALAVRQIVQTLGLNTKVAFVSGDDFRDKVKSINLPHLESGESIQSISSNITSANAYLGSEGIVEALRAGADPEQAYIGSATPPEANPRLSIGAAIFPPGRDYWPIHGPVMNSSARG